MSLGDWLTELRHGLIRPPRRPKLRKRRRSADCTPAHIQPLEPRLLLDGTNDPPGAPPLTVEDVEAQRVSIETAHQAALAAIRTAVMSDWNTLNQTLEAGYATRAQDLQSALTDSAA